MKKQNFIIEFTEKENGQLAKDLEIIIQKEVNFKSKKRKNTPKTPQ